MTIILSIGLLAAAAILGGVAWVVVGLSALLVHHWHRIHLREVAILIAPALCWVILFHFTEDRRLFFPYSVFFAASLALRATWNHAASLVALFLIIRILQDATASVLLVEILVAIAALLPLYFSQKKWKLDWLERGGLALAASLLAFLGLMF